MEEKRSWRQQIKQHRVAAIITASVVVVVIVFIIASYLIAGYWFGWTGFNGDTIIWQPTTMNCTPLPICLEEQQPAKTLWDWLQLLIIPIILAIAGFWLNRIQNDREQKAKEAKEHLEHKSREDNQRETALQAYIDKISELLLEKHLRESEDDEVRSIARVRTLTILPRLDAKRKVSVLLFLYMAGLIDTPKPTVDLGGVGGRTFPVEGKVLRANLQGVDLMGAPLLGANLSGADLSGADLMGATLIGANLSRADLSRANLSKANLIGADLSGADLSGADLSEAELFSANLSGATLSETDLHDAKLSNADLSNADLSNADLRFTDLSGANLSKAKITIEPTDGTRLRGAILPDGLKYH